MAIDYLSLETLSLHLCLPKVYLQRLLKEGKLPYLDTGNGRIRFNPEVVQLILDDLAQKNIKG